MINTYLNHYFDNQWLDLKENPLETELKRASGDCNNEAECRRCATNVKKLISVQAAEEERRQQQKLEQHKSKLIILLHF